MFISSVSDRDREGESEREKHEQCNDQLRGPSSSAVVCKQCGSMPHTPFGMFGFDRRPF